jgi:hypothetical protein
MAARELDLSKFYWNLLELVGAFGKILTIVGFFPNVWQKIGQIQIVVVVVSWNPGKFIGQPFPGINITDLATSQQRIHDGSVSLLLHGCHKTDTLFFQQPRA